MSGLAYTRGALQEFIAKISGWRKSPLASALFSATTSAMELAIS